MTDFTQEMPMPEPKESSLFGRKWYRVDDYSVDGRQTKGAEIQVSWKRFYPSSVDKASLNPHQAVIHGPGYPNSVNDKSVEPFAQALADNSGFQALVVDTYTQRNAPHRLLTQAKARHELLKELQIEEAIITGISQDGAEAIHLTSEAQNDVNIKALFLYESFGLYGRSLADYIGSFVREFGPSRQVGRTQFLGERLTGIFDQMRLAGGSGFPKRTLEEIEESLVVSSSAEKIHVPVVVINGKDDLLVRSWKIKPEEVFPNSPFVRMKQLSGNHDVSTLKPAEVVKASFDLLSEMTHV